MGAERTELLDGQLYWPGDFDERDAVVARRALPGSRIRVEPGVGLTAGPVLEDEPESREWTGEDGTRWQEINGLTLYRRPGERNWTMRPPTREERRHNTEQLAAYTANRADVLAAWRYLTAHPVFRTYRVPNDLADIDPADPGRCRARSCAAAGVRRRGGSSWPPRRPASWPAAASYLISSLAQVAPWIRPGRYVPGMPGRTAAVSAAVATTLTSKARRSSAAGMAAVTPSSAMVAALLIRMSTRPGTAACPRCSSSLRSAGRMRIRSAAAHRPISMACLGQLPA